MKASKFSLRGPSVWTRRKHSSSSRARKARQSRKSAAEPGSAKRLLNWKKKYAGLLPTETKRLKQLEDENSRLKKIVADLTLDSEMLQDVIRRKI